MIATTAPIRRSRFALWLAFLAMAAQFGLGWASAHHHARMLGSGADAWAEVCTPHGIERLSLPGGGDTSQETPRTEAHLGECVICSAAGLSALPMLSLSGALPVLTPRVPDAPVTDNMPATHLALRPPPRAPPRLS